MFSKLATVLGLALGLASATPMMIPNATLAAEHAAHGLERRVDCNSPPSGLTVVDCNYLVKIGAQVGTNSRSNNGQAWIGEGGPSTIHVTNTNANPAAPIILVVWGPSGSWINAVKPLVTYSLTNVGDSVTISLGEGFSGAMAGIYDHLTYLVDGQVFNTWAEFTTQGNGKVGTIDVSRLPNMGGNPMELWTPGAACHASMTECAYVCISGNRCGYVDGQVNLLNCVGPNKNGFWTGKVWTGGCQGWNYGLVNLHMFN
ncbi:hypothetical protein GQ53DRAFT_15808 [Thozetella sp. PMI_491]|nr:hypothetical protein GQ53DRAFT_15808 [Thozetella sp. PMI_491]